MIFVELKVFDVIKICLTFLFFSNFSNNGTILVISPTLAPWNQIKFTPIFFLRVLLKLLTVTI